VVIEGRSVLGEIEGNPDRLSDVLATAARAALKNRSDPKGPDDALELRVRHRLRRLAEIRADYEIERRLSVTVVRQLNDAYERIIAPPAGAASDGSRRVSFQSLTLERQGRNRDQLVALWTTFRAERLALYRDLGTLPFNDWASYQDQFIARPGEPGMAPRVEPNPKNAAPVPGR
jgi:hypothetical protein